MGAWRMLAGSVAIAALVAPAAASADSPPMPDRLKVVAHNELGVPGPHGPVAVAGSAAVVAPGPCTTDPLTVVSLADPKHPQVVATIDVSPGAAALDVDAADVSTPAFTGDLLAVALNAAPPSCRPPSSAAGGGVLFYDLTKPAEPALLGRYPVAVRTVSLALGADRRLLAIAVAAAGDVRVIEATDPRAPSERSRWAPPGSAAANDARLYDLGRSALVASGSAGVQQLDLDLPAAPSVASQVEGTALSATPVVLGERTLALVTDLDGVRAVALTGNEPGREVGRMPTPAPDAPPRVVASGDVAYIAWHASGLRLYDLAAASMPVTATFVPEGLEPDVVGVGLLPDHIVAVDAGSGLWVLQRPREGSKNSIWDDIKVFLFGLGIAGLLIVALVPRVAAGLAMAGSTVARPAMARVRARRPGR